MRERGIATKVDGSAVTVLIHMGEGCASCNSKDGCGLVGRELEGALAPGAAVTVGDAVDIEIPASAGASGALWLLVVPLGLFFGGYIGSGALWPGRGEGVGALSGLAGFALGLAFAATVARRGRMSRRPSVTPAR